MLAANADPSQVESERTCACVRLKTSKAPPVVGWSGGISVRAFHAPFTYRSKSSPGLTLFVDASEIDTPGAEVLRRPGRFG
jgi:hypothetical protein